MNLENCATIEPPFLIPSNSHNFTSFVIPSNSQSQSTLNSSPISLNLTKKKTHRTAQISSHPQSYPTYLYPLSILFHSRISQQSRSNPTLLISSHSHNIIQLSQYHPTLSLAFPSQSQSFSKL